MTLFSAYAEVVPVFSGYSTASSSFLRVCGGSSIPPRGLIAVGGLFSAYAEVVPFHSGTTPPTLTFLRVCGGSSLFITYPIVIYGFSPRMRR
ncbi:Hypothetical protein Cul131001_0034 [Corynebacterium ulcerans]|nr:Hypothetical protein Cul131001_0034 [Corynebacterium ulcerans]